MGSARIPRVFQQIDPPPDGAGLLFARLSPLVTGINCHWLRRGNSANWKCLRVVSGDGSLLALRLLAMSALASPRVILIDRCQAGRSRWRRSSDVSGSSDTASESISSVRRVSPLSILVGVVVRHFVTPHPPSVSFRRSSGGCSLACISAEGGNRPPCSILGRLKSGRRKPVAYVRCRLNCLIFLSSSFFRRPAGRRAACASSRALSAAT